MINMVQELQNLIDEAPDGTEYVCVRLRNGKLNFTYFKRAVGGSFIEVDVL